MKRSSEKGPARKPTVENELLRKALNSFILLKSEDVPESYRTQAQTLLNTPKSTLLKFEDVPLELRVCLVLPSFFVQKFQAQYHQLLWKKHRQLAGIMKYGEISSLIWSSFKLFPEHQQQQGLKKYPTFSRYNQLIELLESIQSTRYQTELHQRQEALANFVKQHRKFISRQLQFDKALREKFLLSLTDAYNKELEPLFQLVARTPALVKDFEQLMDPVINQQYEIVDVPDDADEHPDDTAAKKLALRRYLKTCLHGDIIAHALLDKPDEFTTDFIVKALLKRRGALEEYKANLESTVWHIANAFKAFLELLAPSVAKFLFTTPAMDNEILHSLSTKIEILSKKPQYIDGPSLTTYQTSFRKLRKRDDSLSESDVAGTPLQRSIVDQEGTYFSPMYSDHSEENATLDTDPVVGKNSKRSSQEDQGLAEQEPPQATNMTIDNVESNTALSAQ